MKSLRTVLCILIALVALPTVATEKKLILRTSAQASQPKYLVDMNKAQAGIAFDIMQGIEQIDPGIQFVGKRVVRPFERIKAELVRGEIDVFLGLAFTPALEKQVIFLEPPLYHVANTFFARSSDRIAAASLADIKAAGSGVIAWEGTVQHHFLQSEGFVVAGTPRSIELGLKMLVAGRGRLWLGSEMSTAVALRDLKLRDEVRAVFALPSASRLAAVSRSLDAASRKRLQVALLKLQEQGELERIFVRHCSEILTVSRCEQLGHEARRGAR